MISRMGQQEFRKAKAQLFAISFLSLFFELAFVRFINSTVQVTGYFNNFIIVSAILGLGLGSSIARKDSRRFALTPFLFPIFLALMICLGKVIPGADSDQNVFWTKFSLKNTLPAPLIVLAVFIANLGFFVPLGEKLGKSLQQFENRLLAYSYDLAGSIFGVLFFVLISFWRLQPFVWFMIGGILILFLLQGGLPLKIAAAVAVLLAALVSTLPEKGVWSPYYKVLLEAYHLNGEPNAPILGYAVNVNGLRIQDALDFSKGNLNPRIKAWQSYYELPYYFTQGKKLLILGGGSGNDTAIALKFPFERIDVVEIDPVLAKLGWTLHPSRPYHDPRVHVITDDARAFLRRSNDYYDLIVMNALDSHHQLPGLSTLRLESFIYTTGAFKDIQKHMMPNSTFVLNNSSTREWMGERLFWSLTSAFGREPALFSTRVSPFGSVAFVYTPDLARNLPAVLKHPEVVQLNRTIIHASQAQTKLSTDDWPHLYLATNQIPLMYLYILMAVAVIVFLIFRRPLASLGTSSSLHFFALGSAFMLLETRSITQIALLFGATWIVNAIVIISILLVVFAGNLVLLAGTKLNKPACYVLLLSSLILLYEVPINFILNFTLIWRLLVCLTWIGLPLFFASLIFSMSFEKTENTAEAFAANLLGVGIGGTLEYSSMVYGLNSIYVLSLLFYVLALAADRSFPFHRLGKAQLKLSKVSA